MQNLALQENTNAQPYDKGCADLIGVTHIILKQLLDALQMLTQEQYATRVDKKSSPIGSHVRHVIEFYQAFLKVCVQADTQQICYDDRQRNMVLETSKDAALQELIAVQSSLQNFTMDHGDIDLLSIIDPDQPMIVMKTTRQRELFYILDHAIHHMALIKMLAVQHGVSFDHNFGLAQSTKAHEQSQG